MKSNKHLTLFIGSITLLLACLVVTPALAQADNGLVLRLSKDFGFASGGQIQGTFTIHVTGPANLSRVDFLIDGKQIGEVTQAPFNLQFSTSGFSLGSHTIKAIGYTTDGQELQTPDLTTEFVSANEGMKAAGRVLLPILVIVAAALILSFAFPMLTGRGKRSDLPLGAPRNYGIKGGGICPKCGRPFAFSLLAPNLPFFRFDRCPFCGHWGIVKIASLSDLRKAEAAELEQANAAQSIPEESEEEKLRKEIEDSRFRES